MVPAVRPLGSLSMARGCARIDSRSDTAKKGSYGRLEVHHARLPAVIGVRKTFPHGLDPHRTSETGRCRSPKKMLGCTHWMARPSGGWNATTHVHRASRWRGGVASLGTRAEDSEDASVGGSAVQHAARRSADKSPRRRFARSW